MSIRVTQIGNEVWLRNPSNIRVTQIGNEIWIVPSGGKVRVTTINLTVWRTVAGAPLTITGHADGYAKCFAISSQSQPVAGNADGYATAVMFGKVPPSPIMAYMAI